MIKLSIIIPAYNSEKYILKCLNSILNDKFSDLEVIVVNDGSKDRTNEIIENIKDNRIRLFNNENHGVSYSRNYGLKKALGKYIMFVDADDTLEKDSLYKMMNVIIKENADIVIGQYIQQNKRIIKFNKSQINLIISALTAPNRNYLDSSLLGFVWGRVYSKKVLNNVLFDEKIHFKEDMLFNLDAYNNSNKIIIIPDKCYNYVLNDNSASFKFYPDYDLEIKYFYNILKNKVKSNIVNSEDLYIWGIYMYMNFLKHNLLHKESEGNCLKKIRKTFKNEMWCEIFDNVDSKTIDKKYKLLRFSFKKRLFVIIWIMYKINEMRNMNAK